MKVTGNALVGRTLKRLNVEVGFFLMGGPMMEAENSCIREGIRMIDVRHEQAAAMMAHAYARISLKPGVCMAASGPGVTNLVTGIANAFIDCSPVVALGGSSTLAEYGTGAFQEIDQIAFMRPITKWAERVYDPRRIPEYIATAFRQACSGKPGPVYLDLPGDLLYEEFDEEEVHWPAQWEWTVPKAMADPAAIDAAAALLTKSEKPLILTGTGVFWTEADGELRQLVDELGLPFFTTPQGRGAVPEDHECFFGAARSAAFKEADLFIVAGTRLNYMWQGGKPPRFNADAKFIRIDADPAEFTRGDLAALNVLGDAGYSLHQLRQAARGRVDKAKFASWRKRLAELNAEHGSREEALLTSDQLPIHPLRLCKEVRDFMDRDAILIVDGQEILNYGRRSIPTYHPRHRINSGPFGTMGVGMPFGIGAKAASPDKQVIVLHGDGSFGMNAMELDVAVRHKLPVIVIVSLNGGWTSDPAKRKPGRDLGYTRFDKIAEALGCHAEYIESPDDIRPALVRAQEAVSSGRPALINVVTDSQARAGTIKFASYST